MHLSIGPMRALTMVAGKPRSKEHFMIVNETIGARAFKLAVEVTDTTPDEQVTELLHSTCREFSTAGGTMARFQLVIGRLLVVIRDRKLFKANYKTFDRYMIAEVVDKYGISRATVWTGLQIAQAVPEISVEEATNLGVVKVRDIARAVRHEEAKFTHPGDKQKLLDKLVKQAPKLTVVEFRKQLESNNLLTPRTSPQRLNTIVLRGSPELVAQWETICGERDPIEVFQELLGRKGAHRAPVGGVRRAAA